ncbi:MAG: NIL domain-containing protein [Chloroflexota bacterium]|nr:NIL domain-containing protein [Chloroflexota bacterium]|tara:strand:- start:313 stop:552 length:240 start_codon:yes stop_codon:yes gene_type:complete
MSKLRVTFTYPVDVVQEPVIWLLSQKFEVKTNIRRADVQENLGWVTLELEGEETVLQQGIEWVRSTGTEVELLTGDVIE